MGAVIEGGLSRSENKLHITAQLVSTQDGYHFWSGTFDSEPNEIYSVEEQIVRLPVCHYCPSGLFLIPFLKFAGRRFALAITSCEQRPDSTHCAETPVAYIARPAQGEAGSNGSFY